MNTYEAEKILRTNVKDLSEPLKSAVEFTLATFFAPSAADTAKKFLASVPSMTTPDAQLQARIDAAYYALMNDENVWLDVQDLPHEIWRDVVGFEGLYRVSNMGRVKSLFNGDVKIRRAPLCNPGYFSVVLYKDNEVTHIRIHVLVAQAFLPNPENKRYVNHRDGNKRNNRVDNLEWVTPLENAHHAINMGLTKSGCDHPRAKLNEEQVRYIREVCIPGDRKFGFGALARKFGVGVKAIARIYYNERYRNVT